MATNHGRLLPASQAAIRLGISVDRMRRLIAKGEVVVVRTAEGRLSGVYEADCDAWLARSRAATQAPSIASADVDAEVRALVSDEERVFQ